MIPGHGTMVSWLEFCPTGRFSLLTAKCDFYVFRYFCPLPTFGYEGILRDRRHPPVPFSSGKCLLRHFTKGSLSSLTLLKTEVSQLAANELGAKKSALLSCATPRPPCPRVRCCCRHFASSSQRKLSSSSQAAPRSRPSPLTPTALSLDPYPLPCH